MKHRGFIERSLMGALSLLKESLFCEEYASRKGLLQALDPRIKFLGILSLLLAVMFSRSVSFLMGMYVVCLLLAVCSSIRLGFFLKRTWVFIPLFSLCIALPALLNIVTPGEAIVRFRVGALPLSVTRQGIASAGFFFLRVLTSVSLCAVLVLTTRHYCLLRVMRIFRIPQVFVMTMGMCYRYVYLFIEIVQNTFLAIKSRVGHVSSAKSGQGIVAWNIACLWQRSYQLNEEVYTAMCSRGYRGEPVVLNDFKVRVIDWLWLGIVLLFSGSVFFLSHRTI